MELEKWVVQMPSGKCEITIYQKHRGLWVATGNYMGKPVKANGSSAYSAAQHWQEAAESSGIAHSPH